MDSITQAREILKNTDIPWLELDISFDVAKWKYEAETVSSYYQEYRDGESKGWSSCSLHGLGVDKTQTADCYGYNEYNAPYKYTMLSKLCPTITNFWKNIFPSESYTRIRFMKLASKGIIQWHNDGAIPEGFDPLLSILPINLAIIHPKDCIMEIEGHGIVPWEEGKIFLVNVSKNHQLFNNSNVDRIHMIANLLLGSNTKEFCDLLVRSYKTHYG